ncbi:hypothetical protein Tco_0744144 [Tanacetum coccineum]
MGSIEYTRTERLWRVGLSALFTSDVASVYDSALRVTFTTDTTSDTGRRDKGGSVMDRHVYVSGDVNDVCDWDENLMGDKSGDIGTRMEYNRPACCIDASNNGAQMQRYLGGTLVVTRSIRRELWKDHVICLVSSEVYNFLRMLETQVDDGGCGND